MRIPALLIAAVFGAVTVTLWGLANQPVPEPEWPTRIQGFAFSPYHADQDAVAGDFPSVKQIEDDLVLLKDRTRSIRTYTTDGTIGEVPALAQKHQIKVALGAWIDARFAHNATEIERARKIVQAFADNPMAGVIGLDGEMLDKPHLERAKKLLARLGTAL